MAPRAPFGSAVAASPSLAGAVAAVAERAESGSGAVSSAAPLACTAPLGSADADPRGVLAHAWTHISAPMRSVAPPTVADDERAVTMPVGERFAEDGRRAGTPSTSLPRARPRGARRCAPAGRTAAAATAAATHRIARVSPGSGG
jgi:hypothetical protein